MQLNMPSRHSRSHSRSSSTSTRRPSLTRHRSSQRLVRTISIESFDSLSLEPTAASSEPPQTPPTFTSEESTEYIEVPFVKASLDPTLPQDYLKDDILNLIIQLQIPKWYHHRNSTTREQLQLTKIKGAMTNAIFKIAYPGLPSLLLRIYGPNNDTIIDREYELQVLARLSVRHIGPSLFGCFSNGRFEQFLENATTLNKDDIRAVSYTHLDVYKRQCL